MTECSTRQRSGYRVVLLLAALVGLLQAFGVAASTEPEGLWNCLVYGNSSRPEERLNLLITPQSTAHISVRAAGGTTAWRRVGDWTDRRRELEFVDARTGRTYRADLRYDTLGGTWTTLTRDGGWWCARRIEDPATIDVNRRATDFEFFLPPLVPGLMASPRYPLVAIRQAREGDAVVCFLVDSAGRIHDPQVVRTSDAIFELTTLSAITRSRYRRITQEGLERPGCRVYTYTLDMIDE